jgi:hypothetical protein
MAFAPPVPRFPGRGGSDTVAVAVAPRGNGSRTHIWRHGCCHRGHRRCAADQQCQVCASTRASTKRSRVRCDPRHAVRCLATRPQRDRYEARVLVDRRGRRGGGALVLRDPADSERVLLPASDIVCLEAGTMSVRDGYGGRDVSAIMIELNTAEPCRIPLAPRSERWNAPFRLAASAADRDELLRRIRERFFGSAA